MTKKTFLFCMVLVLIACKGQKEKQVLLSKVSQNDSLFIINIDTANCRRITNMSYWFKKANYIALETNENSLIGRVNQLLIKGDTIFILDATITKKLQMFRNTGKHIGTVSQFGYGPGECTSPSSFGIDDNLLYIFDSDSQKINYYYLPDMKFSHSLTLNSHASSRYIAINKKKIYADAYIRNKQNAYLIQEIDSSSGNTKNKWLSVDEYNSGYLDFNFRGESLFYKSNNSIKYHQKFMNQVIQIKDGKVSTYLTLSSKDFITKEKLSELRNNGWNSEQSIIPLDVLSNIHQYVEWGDYIQFSMDRKIYRNTIFFNKKTNETHLTELVYDNLTFIENQQDINVYPIPIWGDEEGQLSYIHPMEMENFVKFIKEGKTNLSIESMKILQGLSSDSNPVLIYYEKK